MFLNLLHRPRWPQTYRDPYMSLWVLGLKACSTYSWHTFAFWKVRFHKQQAHLKCTRQLRMTLNSWCFFLKCWLYRHAPSCLTWRVFCLVGLVKFFSFSLVGNLIYWDMISPYTGSDINLSRSECAREVPSTIKQTRAQISTAVGKGNKTGQGSQERTRDQ